MEYCKDNNGHLASIANQKIYAYLSSKVRWALLHYWVGENYKTEEGRWLWSDWNLWNFNLFATKPWEQPDNSGAGEGCLKINDQLTWDGWNDDNCERKHKFIWSKIICQNHTALRNDPSFVDGVDVTIMVIGLSSGLILILIVALTIGFLVYRRSKTEEMAQF